MHIPCLTFEFTGDLGCIDNGRWVINQLTKASLGSTYKKMRKHPWNMINTFLVAFPHGNVYRVPELDQLDASPGPDGFKFRPLARWLEKWLFGHGPWRPFFKHVAVCQNPGTPVVHIKIAGIYGCSSP